MFSEDARRGGLDLRGIVQGTQRIAHPKDERLPLFACAQRRLGVRALHEVSSEARENVKEAIAFGARCMRMVPVGGQHADDAPAARDKRRRLHRHDSGFAEGRHLVGIGFERIDIRHDNAFLSGQRASASTADIGIDVRPKRCGLRVKAGMRKQFQPRIGSVESLDACSVRTHERARHFYEAVVMAVWGRFGNKLVAYLLKLSCIFQLCCEVRFALADD
jgi:hypothetical protein